MEASAAVIRRGRKFEQVLAGAREVFLADGFERASMDDVARAAGVSKATLYAYFTDKRLLFVEVAMAEIARQSEAACAEIDISLPAPRLLHEIGQRFLRFALSRFGQQIFRICVAEAHRFPELGEAFYASGPRAFRSLMLDYLHAATARGELVVPDPEMAADQFPELCKAGLWARAICGVQESFTDAEIDRVVGAAVETFLARYGAAPRPAPGA